MVVKDEEQGIKDLLKEAGLLIEQKNKPEHSLNCFKLSSRSSFKSYSENNNDSDQHFCIYELIQSRIATCSEAFLRGGEETSCRTWNTLRTGMSVTAIKIFY